MWISSYICYVLWFFVFVFCFVLVCLFLWNRKDCSQIKNTSIYYILLKKEDIINQCWLVSNTFRYPPLFFTKKITEMSIRNSASLGVSCYKWLHLLWVLYSKTKTKLITLFVFLILKSVLLLSNIEKCCFCGNSNWKS